MTCDDLEFDRRWERTKYWLDEFLFKIIIRYQLAGDAKRHMYNDDMGFKSSNAGSCGKVLEHRLELQVTGVSTTEPAGDR